MMAPIPTNIGKVSMGFIGEDSCSRPRECPHLKVEIWGTRLVAGLFHGLLDGAVSPLRKTGWPDTRAFGVS
jgi:hypothetical protein